MPGGFFEVRRLDEDVELDESPGIRSACTDLVL